MQKVIIQLFTIIAVMFVPLAQAESNVVPTLPPQWGIAYYHSWMTSSNIGNVITTVNLHFKYGSMDSLEIAKELAIDNPVRRFFSPIVGRMEVAANVTHRNDPRGDIYEVAPYIVWRWQGFPWDQYLVNSFAIGDGVSYVSSMPEREIRDASYHQKNPRRLLNILMLEATFALPKHPDRQLFIRIHHRCGMWGVFGAGNLSSNAVGVGARIWF